MYQQQSSLVLAFGICWMDAGLQILINWFDSSRGLSVDLFADRPFAKYCANVNSDEPYDVFIGRPSIFGCYCHPLPCHGEVMAEVANDEG